MKTEPPEAEMKLWQETTLVSVKEAANIVYRVSCTETAQKFPPEFWVAVGVLAGAALKAEGKP